MALGNVRHPIRSYRGDKTVAMTGHRFNEAGVIGVVIEGDPKLLQSNVQASVEVNESTFRPKLLPQFLTRDDFFGMLQQQQEHSKRLVLNFDAHAVAGQRVATGIGHELAEAEDLYGRGCTHHGQATANWRES